jgi:hypothetical protein
MIDKKTLQNGGGAMLDKDQARTSESKPENTASVDALNELDLQGLEFPIGLTPAQLRLAEALAD